MSRQLSAFSRQLFARYISVILGRVGELKADR
jgi:hypothetical protein